ncbi:MAG: DOMON-like domain-containing protein [Proteobacteria bacterium]|jgi:hypothetical protein|nr:DOMON-like domain-containing protein [Pseudomonadota bacterium]
MAAPPHAPPDALLLPLVPHPATPLATAVRLGAQVWRERTALRLRYVLQTALKALRLPPPSSAPQARDGLWQHTCFEAFVGAPGTPRYREFNFSPSGDWAAYAFSAERLRDPAADPLPAPRIACTAGAQGLTLDAWLPAAALPAEPGPLLLGLSAVLETRDGGLGYWALRHPAARPDFHAHAGWTATLPAAENSTPITP